MYINATLFLLPVCPCFAHKALPTRVPPPNKFNAGVFMPVRSEILALCMCYIVLLAFTNEIDSLWVNMVNLAWDPEML